MAFEITIKGLKQFKAAIDKNPQSVLDETRKFLTRGLAEYKSGIVNSPWRIGGRGGGAPVSNDPRYPRFHQRQNSGNLRDTHMVTINGLQGIIGPDLNRAPYARYVHEGTGKMQSRPWLDFVKKTKESAIVSLYRALLKNITRNLAK